MHADPDAAKAIVPRIKELGLEPYAPAWRETVVLD